MNDAVFSPDSSLVVATTRDSNGVGVWDAGSGLIVDIFESEGYLTSAAVSRNGKHIAVEMPQNGEHGAQVWNLRPPALDDPECLQLSIEIRTGLAWDDEAKRPFVLSANDLSNRQERLRTDFDGSFCDAREW